MRRFQVTRKHVQIIYSYSIVLTPSKTHTTVSKPETSPQSSWCYPDNCCHNIEWIYFFFFKGINLPTHRLPWPWKNLF